MAGALGLGKIAGDTSLGQSLQIEIPLTGSLDAPLDNNCVSIRRPAESIDPDYFPRDIVARVDKQATGTRLLVATRSAIRQPFVEFRVVVTCGYNLSRDYVLVVAPPERAAVADTQPLAAAMARPVAAAAVPVTSSAAAGNSGALPDGVSGRNITLDREMTLEQLARQHFPGPLRQERFMRWVLEANPQFFANAGNLRQHRLAAGTQLVVPAGVPPRRLGDHQDGASPLDRAGAAPTVRPQAVEAVAKPAVRTKAPAAKGTQDRLVVGSGGGNIKDYKEAMALVQRLTGMMEQQVAAQSANDEKIRALETEVATVKNALAQTEATARQREAQILAEVLAAKRGQEELAERGWWQVLIAIAAGGVLGATLLQGTRLLGHRKDEVDLPGFEPAAKATESAKAEKATAPATAQPASQPVPITGATAATAATPRPAPTVRTVPGPTRKPHSERDPLDFTPPPFLQGEPRRASTVQSSTAVAEVAVQETADPATAAIELANIMTSMGLTESAAQTLVEHIRENPRQSLHHWLKLLELHRINGKREDFERSSQELRQHFNVQAEEWSAPIGTGRGSLETYPHIRGQITKLWQDPSCVKYLHSLLMDNRDGTRTGFPLAVAEEILLLIAIQSDGQ